MKEKKEPVRQQAIKDPTLKLPRRKTNYVTKPVTISQPIAQPKLPQTDPKYRGKQKVVFKSKKELAKEAQQKVDEQLEKDIHTKKLKVNQEVLKKKSSEISLKKRTHAR